MLNPGKHCIDGLRSNSTNVFVKWVTGGAQKTAVTMIPSLSAAFLPLLPSHQETTYCEGSAGMVFIGANPFTSNCASV